MATLTLTEVQKRQLYVANYADASQLGTAITLLTWDTETDLLSSNYFDDQTLSLIQQRLNQLLAYIRDGGSIIGASAAHLARLVKLTPLSAANAGSLRYLTAGSNVSIAIAPAAGVASARFYLEIPHSTTSPITSQADESSSASTAAGLYNVRDYGAVGDGTNDDTSAIQEAIDAAGLAGGGTVFLPRGTYRVQPQASGENVLYIRYDNVTLAGESPGTTTLKCYVFGGATPNGETPGTNFEVLAGLVWRGNGIAIMGTDDVDNPRKNFTLRDIRLTGQCPRQTNLFPYDDGGALFFPASTVNGNGWDLTHKGVYIQENKNHDNHSFINCIMDSWRGEVIYYGGVGANRINIIDCDIYDTNASAVSMTARMVLRGSRVYKATHAVENTAFLRENLITDNEFFTCGKGVVFTANIDGTSGDSIIARNYFHECTVSGIWVTGYAQHVRVFENTFRDCSTGTGPSLDDGNIRLLGQFGGSPSDITIENNTFVADAITVYCGIYLDCNDLRKVVIRNNNWTRSRAAVTAGRYVYRSFRVALSGTYDVKVIGNRFECFLMPEVRNSVTENKIPLYKDNFYVSGVIHQCLMTADGAVEAFVFSEQMQCDSDTVGVYKAFPSIATTNILAGQRCQIINQTPTKPAYFPQTGAGHKFRRPYFINSGVRLTVEFDGTRWIDVGYEVAGSIAGKIRANDLLPQGTTVALWGTDITAYGTNYVKLDPAGAVSYATFSHFPEGEVVTVEVNANVTIKNNAAIILQAAADWVPGGTGGIISFIKPVGVAKIYEVSKLAF